MVQGIRCTDCNLVKTLDEFYVNHHGRRLALCKKCSWAIRVRKRIIGTKVDKDRGLNKYHGYDMTMDEYRAMVIRQQHLCALCGERETGKALRNADGRMTPLLVDHCHKTNKVRGLLCTKCNVGLGMFNDSVAKLNRAIDYLNSNSTSQ